MSWLSSLVRGLKVRNVIKTAVKQARAALLVMDEREVTRAKATICVRIQQQRKVPGEIRRWAVAWVDSLDATDVDNLLTRLEEAL